MKDKEREEHTLSRQELGEFLEKLATELRQGALVAGGRSWSLPEAADVALHVKEKKGRLVAKLTCRFSTLETYEPPARLEVARWRGSFKEVKDRLAAALREVQKALMQGTFPEDAAIQAFVENSQALADLAEPEWQDPMQEYLTHLEKFRQAFVDRQLESMRAELKSLHIHMATCHREFK